MIGNWTGQLRARRMEPVLAVTLLCVALSGHAGAAGSFDGVYKGTESPIRTSDSAECRNVDQHRTTITIKDNHFTRTWIVPIDVDVQANGAFEASKQPGSGPTRTVDIKGQITGGNLEADIGTRYCAGHLSLKRR